ncbi:MAG: hypothetical protein AAFO69_03930 [Bacteroidota bacterium]
MILFMAHIGTGSAIEEVKDKKNTPTTKVGVNDPIIGPLNQLWSFKFLQKNNLIVIIPFLSNVKIPNN